MYLTGRGKKQSNDNWSGVKFLCDHNICMIKAVIFDWGGTIAVAEAPWDTISERIADRLQLEDINLEPMDIKKSIDKATQYRREQAKLGVELNSFQFFSQP